MKMADYSVLLNTAYTVHLPNWHQEFLCIFFYQSNKLLLQYVGYESFSLTIYKILKKFISSKAILRFDQITLFRDQPTK